jgi:hypothetical protein
VLTSAEHNWLAGEKAILTGNIEQLLVVDRQSHVAAELNVKAVRSTAANQQKPAECRGPFGRQPWIKATAGGLEHRATGGLMKHGITGLQRQRKSGGGFVGVWFLGRLSGEWLGGSHGRGEQSCDGKNENGRGEHWPRNAEVTRFWEKHEQFQHG